MIIKTELVNSYEEVWVKNEEMSLRLIDNAIEQDRLPSRLSLVATFLISAAVAPLWIITKITQIVVNVFRILYDLIMNDQRGRRLAYNICRVGLDIATLFTGIGSTAVQIAASFIGVFRPLAGAELWKKSIHIEAHMVKIYANLKNRLKVVDATNEVIGISPYNARLLLGKSLAEDILNDQKSAPEQKKMLEEIKEKMAILFTELSTNYPTYFNKKYPEDYLKSKTITWDSTKTYNKVDIKAKLDNVYVRDLEELYKQIGHIFIFSTLTSGLHISEYHKLLRETEDHKRTLDELFNNYLHFGAVRTPESID